METRYGRLVVCAMVVFLVLALLPAGAWAEKKIGVLIWSDEARFAESFQGMKDQLAMEGFREPAVKYTVENAGGNKAKAAELAQKLAAGKFDLIFAMGTSAAVAIAKEIKTTPVVFSMVYDPVDSKIALAWTSSGNNTTGSSPRVSMAHIIMTLKQLAPVKTLAVLYTPGEKNSEAQLKDIQAAQAETQVKVLPAPLASKEEIATLLPAVVKASDAVYLTGSGVIGGSVQAIVDIASKSGVLTVSHLDDIVEKGALLGVCSNSTKVGKLAGVMAVKVLKGAKPEAVPIEALNKFDVIINMKTAKAAKISIPEAFRKSVTRVIE
jgi:putative ABC transport system substrate-binding protein